MFKKLALTLFVSGCVMLPVFCADSQESVISTDASVNREIAPDTARIRFYVENSGLNLSDLKAKNDKIVNAAVAAIKAKLGENEQIKTIAFNVRNIYSYKDKVRVFQKYEVQNGFEVKLKDMDKISQIINLAMDNGVKNVSGLNFSVENSESICNEMMAESIQIAKSRAQYLAKSAGVSLDKVKNINPYCSLSAGHVQYKTMAYSANSARGAMADGAVETEAIEPGTINARASVNMSYYLK